MTTDTPFLTTPPEDGRDYDCGCARCGSSMVWMDCETCGGEGTDGHDCGEDCCMCLRPEENVRCDMCNGEGGEHLCCSSEEWCSANPIEGREDVKRHTAEWFANILSIMTDTPKKTGPYSIILADPPWQFNDKCNAGNRGASHKYDVMNVSDIMSLPVNKIAAENCLLAMWWVAAMPQEALDVVRAWGFKIKTMTGFTWHKMSKHGREHIGMGNYTRANAENCLFAIKGRPQRVNKGVRQFISARVGAHSQKPVECRVRLEELMGDVPRLEMFARDTMAGWDHFGNELEGGIEL